MMPAVDQNGVPDLDSVRQMIDGLEKLIAGHRVRAAWVCEAGGIAEGLFKMSLGNRDRRNPLRRLLRRFLVRAPPRRRYYLLR